MRKIIICMFIFGTGLNGAAQTTSIIASTKGIAPIPAFMRNGPTIFVSHNTNVTKHFELSPDVAFSMKNGELWFTDLWARINMYLDTAKKWQFTVGADFPSFFGQKYSEGTKEIDQYVMYPTGQLRMIYTASKNIGLTVDYWYTHATQMEYGVKGSYLSFAGVWSEQIGHDKKFTFNVNPNLFYLNYSDKTSGFAFSTSLQLVHVKSGFFISTQGLTPLSVKNLDATGNVSIGVTRKLF